MASLVPRFNCPSLHQTPQAKARGLFNFRIECSSSQMTAVIDFEKTQIPTVEAYSTSLAASRASRYVGAVGLPFKTDLEATLATEELLTSEEATIEAAAAEAIALARAALEVAKDAALMKGKEPSIKLSRSENTQPEHDQILLERVRQEELESLGTANNSSTPEIELEEDNSTQNDLDLQQVLGSKCIAVRSRRQIERRARRAKASVKAASSVISVN